MKRSLSALIIISMLLTALVSLSSCDGGESKSPSRGKTISYVYFNTVSTMMVYGDVSDETFDSYLSESEKILSYYHKLFDIYYDYSGVNNIRLINQRAGGEPVKVDPELIDFLSYCKELYTLTKGKTNVMMPTMIRARHLYRIWNSFARHRHIRR